MTEATRVRLTRKPDKSLAETDFGVEKIRLKSPSDAEVLVRVRYISLDPYLAPMMRSWQGPDPAWGQGIIVGRMVGRVLESRDPAFSRGDWVAGPGHWQSHELCHGSILRRIDVEASVPGSAFLGVMGSSGLTAWVGINRILRLSPGETLTISSAAGIVGGIAGQLAKRLGARVVGIAGGPEKCASVVSELGFDACIDYRHPEFRSQLKKAVGSGIDAHYENVGAPTLDPALSLMRERGRIALCGLIAHYLDDETICLKNFRKLLTSGLNIRGFRVFDYLEETDTAHGELRAALKSGDLALRETITPGLENAPRAYLDMLAGKGMGKYLIDLEDDPA